MIGSWFASEAGRATSGARISEIHPADTLRARPPTQLIGGSTFFPTFEEVEMPAVYVAVLPNGHLCADERNGAVLSPDGRLIWDASYGHEERAAEHWFFTAKLPAAERVPESIATLMLRPGWSDYYFHWMFEVLPRLHVLELSGVPVDKYAIHPLSAPFQYETLRALEFPMDKLLELSEPMHLAAKELLVPSVLPSVMPHWACDFLRHTFLPSHRRTSDARRLYISRATASRGRRVVNDSEVEEVLAARGFETVRLEEMSVVDQARLFAQVEVVVSPHGGGLTNVVFCNPGAKVVEFFAREYVQPLFWMLSNRRELEYYCLIADGEGPQSWTSWPPDGGVEPISVDIDALRGVLTAAGI
jgi:Glycosyltransferase 61